MTRTKAITVACLAIVGILVLAFVGAGRSVDLGVLDPGAETIGAVLSCRASRRILAHAG